MKTIRITCRTGFEEDIENLHVLQGDLKDLSKENYEKLKNEILKEGFDAPFFVWQENKDLNWILDGTQRHRVLTKMRAEGYLIPLLPIVPIIAESMAEAKRKLLGYASQYGQVTGQGLYEFLSKGGISFDEMSERFRFPEIKNDDFEEEFYAPTGPVEGEDDVPEAGPTFIALGNIFALDNHRLLCGDSTRVPDVERLMNGEKADMIFTDPPYNIAYEGKTEKKLTIENDEMSNEGFSKFLLESYKRMFEVMHSGAPIYVCHADSERVNFTECFLKAGLKLSSVIVWNKNVATFGRMDYFWKHEPILYGWKEGSAHKWYGPNNEVSVWDIDRPAKSEEHPTMKPIALIERALKNSSKKGNLLFEPFGGSGSTLIACEKMNRKCYTIEIDPKYCGVILDRWCKFTGKEAYRINEDGSQTAWSLLCGGGEGASISKKDNK